MALKSTVKLEGVAETLLLPLYVLAKESHHPDPILKDEAAADLLARIDYDFSKIRLREHDEVLLAIRHREFDRHVREFLLKHPQALVAHIGCGLDTRFERVDNGQVQWYDIDLPEVIQLRRQLIGLACPRYHMLADSVFGDRWLDQLSVHIPLPVMVIAEGLFIYFEEEQVKRIVLALRERFPGAELVFDGASPLMIGLDNLHLVWTRVKARAHWGLKTPQELESWSPDIRLLEAWYYFDRPEPRLQAMSWMKPFTFISRGSGIYHYRLGAPAPA